MIPVTPEWLKRKRYLRTQFRTAGAKVFACRGAVVPFAIGEGRTEKGTKNYKGTEAVNPPT